MQKSFRAPLVCPNYRNLPPCNFSPAIPPALSILYNACHRIYPDQDNPLQVAAVVKYWLGGPDPLDYVSMYFNPGNTEQGIDPHYHYISFGLSDLHGDGRVHEVTRPEEPSGFGFELTFRLKVDQSQFGLPPTWPAALMQALAKYVFQSKNVMCAGDHISWHCPLDNSDSRLQHILVCADPQLNTVHTPNGSVEFLQIVGVCPDELLAAQRWNGIGMIELLKKLKESGGPWLVTDMRRENTIFEMDSGMQNLVDKGVEEEGSNLSGVCAKCIWEERKLADEDNDDGSEDANLVRGFAQISVQDTEQIKETLKKGLQDSKCSGPIPSASSQFFGMQNEDPDNIEGADVVNTEPKFFDRVHLTFNLEAGTIFPMALKGRLKHGKHFTFKNITPDYVITLVPAAVTGAFVDSDRTFGAHGPWLQVYLSADSIDEMLTDLVEITESDELVLPKTFEWSDKRLIVTFMTDDW